MDATDSKFKFATNASAAGSLTSTTLFTVQPTGEVGIGTTTPGQLLHISDAGTVIAKITSSTFSGGEAGVDFDVNGIISLDWRMPLSGSFLTLASSTDNLNTLTNRYQFQSSAFMPMVNGTQNLGGSGNLWNTVFAANGTINTSDIREKTNIQSIGYGLAEVMSYTWKERPEEGEKLGLIAQELQEILPEVVRDWDWKEDEHGQRTKVEAERLGVFYSDLIPVLIQAIQEQQESIEQLKARVEELEGE